MFRCLQLAAPRVCGYVSSHGDYAVNDEFKRLEKGALEKYLPHDLALKWYAEMEAAWTDPGRKYLDNTEHTGLLLASANEVFSSMTCGAPQNLTRAAMHFTHRNPDLESGTANKGAGIQVFISYVREDAVHANKLYQRLLSVGLSPWLDTASLLPGEQWREMTLQAVRQSQFVLACLSIHALDKRGFFQREIKLAVDICQEKLPRDIHLIPVRFEDCETPEALEKYQWVNLYDSNGWIRLLNGLRAGIERQGLVVPAPLLAELEKLSAPHTPRDTTYILETRLPMIGKVLTFTGLPQMELVRIPSGAFLMGSDPTQDMNANRNEKPQHTVDLTEYYIGKYPITNSQYGAFVKDTRYSAPGHWRNDAIPTGLEQHPVVNVAWHDAMAYCRWLEEITGQSYRLPSEAEWEKAASWDVKTNRKRIWPWGDSFDSSKCNTAERNNGKTTEVGVYSPKGDSAFGVGDMAGNVWEWTLSLIRDYRYLPGDSREDPRIEGLRVLRGGSFAADSSRARCAHRERDLPNRRIGDYGFRVCLPSDL